MDNKLFHLSDIMEIYGLTEYEAKTLMNRVPKINIGRGSIRPRWVVRQDDIETYLAKKKQREEIGLDRFGRILRKR